MTSTKELFDKINVFYKGVELSKYPMLKEYGDFLCAIIDSSEKHIGAIALHTGSEYYQALAVAISVLKCLFYNNTENSELINSLSKDDLLILNGQRVRFLGLTDGVSINLQDKKYFSYCFDDKSMAIKYIPLESALKLNISLYQGNAEKLGSRGIKTTLKARKNFLEAFFDKTNKNEISTEINYSIACIIDGNIAEKLYREIQFGYQGIKVSLCDIVTASRYSDEECYQIGNNPTKEEPIIKFYSKVSSCRNAIIDDKEKRIIGCIVLNENFWVSNNEVNDIIDRKGLKFSLMLGKTHYTKYLKWYQSDSYLFYASVPETVKKFLYENEFLIYPKSMKSELLSFSKHEIYLNSIKSETDYKTFSEIRKRLLKIKREYPNSEYKDNFLMESYFLLNLCCSSFFPLLYYDKMRENNIFGETISERLKVLKDFKDSLIGEIKEDVTFVEIEIEHIILEIYHSNPKGEYIKSKLLSDSTICIVVTKSYYEKLFSFWLDDCKIIAHPKFMTVSEFEKGGNVFDNVIFTTAYYDSLFNPYASFSFETGYLLLYDYEEFYAMTLKKLAEQGKYLIHNKNVINYDINAPFVDLNSNEEYTEDISFETEMETLARDLQLKRAYRYISDIKTSQETLVKIEKIITFVSGKIGYFTKYYKGYCICGDIVKEIDLNNLQVGDKMVFTKQSENKDIVDLLLKQLLNENLRNTEYPEIYRLSICWKQALKNYMDSYDLSYQDLADRLGRKGCLKHQVTVRSWLVEEFHIVGPRDLSDYKAIVALTNLNEFPDQIKEACEKIRSLRTKILDLLGNAILRSIFTETDDKDSVSALVYKNVNKLTQIEEIESISDLISDANIPNYMINKPFDI